VGLVVLGLLLRLRVLRLLEVAVEVVDRQRLVVLGVLVGVVPGVLQLLERLERLTLVAVEAAEV
jgi:hypothetical protein